MTDKLRQAAEMALKALETVRPYEVVDYDPIEKAIKALRQILTKPEQYVSPVAHMFGDTR